MKLPTWFIYVLIAFASLSAFTLGPARSGARDAAQAIFLPVAFPVRKVGLAMSDRVAPAHEADTLSPGSARNVDEIRRQNTLLAGRLAYLEAQLDDTRQQLAHYQTLDVDLRNRVRSAAVLAGPTATRQTLTISATGHNLRERMAVIDPKGFIGQVYGVATGGATAKVLLVTDGESRLIARFERLVNDPDAGAKIVAIDKLMPLVEGTGRGLAVRRLTATDVRNVVRVGDVAVLTDPAFPALAGLRIGTVSKVNVPSTYNGFAEIELQPVTDLPTLRDVLIVEK